MMLFRGKIGSQQQRAVLNSFKPRAILINYFKKHLFCRLHSHQTALCSPSALPNNSSRSSHLKCSFTIKTDMDFSWYSALILASYDRLVSGLVVLKHTWERSEWGRKSRYWWSDWPAQEIRKSLQFDGILLWFGLRSPQTLQHAS